MDFSSLSFDYCHNNILHLFPTACESSKMVAEVFSVRFDRPLLLGIKCLCCVYFLYFP